MTRIFLRTGRSQSPEGRLYPHLPETSRYPEWQPGIGEVSVVKPKCIICGDPYPYQRRDFGHRDDGICTPSCRAASKELKHVKSQILDTLDKPCRETTIVAMFGGGYSHQRKCKQALHILEASGEITKYVTGEDVFYKMAEPEEPKGGLLSPAPGDKQSILDALDTVDPDVFALYQDARKRAKDLQAEVEHHRSELSKKESELNGVADDLVKLRGHLLKELKV